MENSILEPDCLQFYNTAVKPLFRHWSIQFSSPNICKRFYNTAVKPLLSRSTTGEFNSPPEEAPLAFEGTFESGGRKTRGITVRKRGQTDT
eukprot:1187231-Prorocentrum_minimum.AAC.2